MHLLDFGKAGSELFLKSLSFNQYLLFHPSDVAGVDCLGRVELIFFSSDWRHSINVDCIFGPNPRTFAIAVWVRSAAVSMP
jgi:hypothetical protein